MNSLQMCGSPYYNINECNIEMCLEQLCLSVNIKFFISVCSRSSLDVVSGMSEHLLKLLPLLLAVNRLMSPHCLSRFLYFYLLLSSAYI